MVYFLIFLIFDDIGSLTFESDGTNSEPIFQSTRRPLSEQSVMSNHMGALKELRQQRCLLFAVFAVSNLSDQKIILFL